MSERGGWGVGAEVNRTAAWETFNRKGTLWWKNPSVQAHALPCLPTGYDHEGLSTPPRSPPSSSLVCRNTIHAHRICLSVCQAVQSWASASSGATRTSRPFSWNIWITSVTSSFLFPMHLTFNGRNVTRGTHFWVPTNHKQLSTLCLDPFIRRKLFFAWINAYLRRNWVWKGRRKSTNKNLLWMFTDHNMFCHTLRKKLLKNLHWLTA